MINSIYQVIMNPLKMSKFNIEIIWVLLSMVFVQSLAGDYYRDSISDGQTIEFGIQEMTPTREIKIYYDNKLIVTQEGVPEKSSNVLSNIFKYFNFKEIHYQNIIPDTETLMLDPERLNSEETFYVYHRKGQIHVYQGEENIVTNSVPDFDATFNSGDTVSMNSNEFNSEKLVSIFFKDNQLVMTQVAAPEETNLNLLPINYLQTITSDKNKILFHPAKFHPEIKIHIRHQDHKLFVWTGDSDQVPTESIDTPEIVEVIEPVFDTCFDTGETADIFPEEFNMKKLVWIFFDNNQLNVTQMGAPKETKKTEYKYHSLSVISSDSNKLLLRPAGITVGEPINVRHENNKIYLWQGSDQVPTKNINRPDIVKVIKPIEDKSGELEVVSEKPVDNYSSDVNKNTLMIIPKLNLTQSISIGIGNNNENEIEMQNNTHLEISNETNGDNLQVVKPNPSFMFYPINVNLNLVININNPRGSEKPETKPEESILHGTIANNRTMTIYPKELNPKKLVKVSYKNGSLEVTQNGTSEESSNATEPFSYVNLQTIKPDTVTLLLHLAYINSSLVINIRHQNGQIYIWQGSDQLPQLNVDMPKAVEVIGSNEDDEKPEIVPDLDLSGPDDKLLFLFPNMYNPDKLVAVKHEDHKIYAYQIERVDDGSKSKDYTKELDLSIPEKSVGTFDPLKISPGRMIIIVYATKITRVIYG